MELTDERARARVTVRDELKQQAGLVHGGVFASIAESLAALERNGTNLMTVQGANQRTAGVATGNLPTP